MEAQLKDNGTAQLLMPLLARVPAFPEGESCSFPVCSRELEDPGAKKAAPILWALGLVRLQNSSMIRDTCHPCPWLLHEKRGA